MALTYGADYRKLRSHQIGTAPLKSLKGDVAPLVNKVAAVLLDSFAARTGVTGPNVRSGSPTIGEKDVIAIRELVKKFRTALGKMDFTVAKGDVQDISKDISSKVFDLAIQEAVSERNRAVGGKLKDYTQAQIAVFLSRNPEYEKVKGLFVDEVKKAVV